MTERAEIPLVFQCASSALVGMVHPGAPGARTGVLVVVGGPQYRTGSHRQFVLMARAFARAGIPVMRFDYRGMGDADGEFRGFEDVTVDLRSAIDTFMSVTPGLEQVVLWGLCDGASAALLYASTDARVGGLVIVNPWVHTEAAQAKVFLKHYYLQRLLSRSFWAKVFLFQFGFVRSLRELAGAVRSATAPAAATQSAATTSFIDRMLAGFRAFGGPVLVLISERDFTAKEFTDLCATHLGWRKAMERKAVRQIALSGADHTFTTRADLERMTDLCSRWLLETWPHEAARVAAGMRA